MFSHQRQGEPPHVAVVPGWRVTVERHMNKTALLFGVGASLILAAGTASAAGSCGAEVAELQQKLGMEEGANATIGATDPGVQQPAPEANASADTSTTTTTEPTTDSSSSTTTADNTGANATIGPTDPGVQQPQNTDATADSSSSTTTTTDSSTTTADSSTTTMPSGTVEETSRVGDMNTSAGGRAEAITALKKAQLAADAGDENACMTELGTAKAALGIQ
jgi:hypothetical protein